MAVQTPLRAQSWSPGGPAAGVLGWAPLRERLLARYEEFVVRLARRLGSADLAREVLHDTYLQLARGVAAPQVSNPDGYIFRAALNIAHNRRVRDTRYLNDGADAILPHLSDETPDPARAAEASSEADHVRRALAELPARRRDIFTASWVDETPHAELAIRHGVHVRTIQRELQEATNFVRARCRRDGGGPPPRQAPLFPADPTPSRGQARAGRTAPAGASSDSRHKIFKEPSVVAQRRRLSERATLPSLRLLASD